MTKISQTFLKNFAEYQLGEVCEYQFYHKNIAKTPVKWPSTDAMELGKYFEYKCTGYFDHRDGVPVRKSKTDYDRADINAELYKETIQHYGLHVTSVGAMLETDTMRGLLDVSAIRKSDGRHVIIDLKYAAGFDDEWGAFGWGEKTIEQKDSLLIQSVQYVIMYYELTGVVPEFQFWIFNAKKERDAKIYNVNIDKDRIRQHGEMIEKSIDFIEQTKEKVKSGVPPEKLFPPRPRMSDCNGCGMRWQCPFAAIVPPVININY